MLDGDPQAGNPAILVLTPPESNVRLTSPSLSQARYITRHQKMVKSEALPEGLEPSTIRLTGDRSAIELRENREKQPLVRYTHTERKIKKRGV